MTDFADDLLDGVAAIAEFTGMPVRRIYYLAEAGQLPLFKIGERRWQGRKSTLRQHLDQLEESQRVLSERKRAQKCTPAA
jgi:hypothetical protein